MLALHRILIFKIICRQMTPVTAMLFASLLVMVIMFFMFASCNSCVSTIYVDRQPQQQQQYSHVMHHGNVTTSRRQAPPPDRPYVPTRACAEFHQVGFVYDADQGIKAPLYGRPAPRNPSRWQYYLRTDDADVRVRVKIKGRSSMEDTGCDELQTDDVINAPELLHGDVKVHVYDRLNV